MLHRRRRRRRLGIGGERDCVAGRAVIHDGRRGIGGLRIAKIGTALFARKGRVNGIGP